MDNIIEPNQYFDFSQISLAQPIGLQGGAYFTKILFNNKSLYIQTPKSMSRQGFVKSGKKIHCDLMFDNTNSNFIQWIENLEQKCQELIFEKSDSWFQNSLEKDDIESAFNSSLKIYKSGKFYLLRTNVKTNNLTGSAIIKIFNENESVMHMEEVTPETNIVSIIEIQGIKFTNRNFQIEMEIKQVMVLCEEEIFESCLIKKSNTQNNNTTSTPDKLQFNSYSKKFDSNSDIERKPQDISLEPVDIDKLNETTETILKELDLVEIKDDEEISITDNKSSNLEKNPIEIVIEDLETNNNPNIEISEFDLSNDTSKNLETITLKKPNQVYYEIYKEARKKAKEAKQTAILAYLEAKNIKKTYMLEDIDSSDSDMSDFSDTYDENDLDENEEIEAEILE